MIMLEKTLEHIGDIDKAPFRALIEHFREQARGAELVEPLAKARKKGAKRAPRVHDIFVHPTFPFGKISLKIIRDFDPPKSEALRWQLEYFRAIMDRMLANPDHSIIIHDKDSVAKELTLLHPKKVQSHPKNPMGYLDAKGMRSLLKKLVGLHPEDRYVVHGAGWGYCPGQFATQLLCLTQYGGFLPYIPPVRDLGIRIPRGWRVDVNERQLYKIIKRYRLDQLSTIVYGVQHNTAFCEKDDERFVGEETVVIPSPAALLQNGV
jgi:hypothetical protein